MVLSMVMRALAMMAMSMVMLIAALALLANPRITKPFIVTIALAHHSCVHEHTHSHAYHQAAGPVISATIMSWTFFTDFLVMCN